MKLDRIKVDVVKQEQGDWIDKIPEMEGLRLKVRGSANRDYRKLQARLMANVPRNQRTKGFDPETQDSIIAKCLLTCLLDWDGVEIGGVVVPYSKEKAIELVTAPEWVRFREAVIWAASVVTDQQDEAIEDDAGN